jgi:hypothetical protein
MLAPGLATAQEYAVNEEVQNRVHLCYAHGFAVDLVQQSESLQEELDRCAQRLRGGAQRLAYARGEAFKTGDCFGNQGASSGREPGSQLGISGSRQFEFDAQHQPVPFVCVLSCVLFDAGPY